MDTHSSGEQEQVVPEASPFSEYAGEKRFFPGGGRQAILDEMIQTLTGGTPIVTLAGEDGSGKTIICRLLKQAMTFGYATVFFQRTVESFEEVLRAAARELGFAADAIPADSPGLLQFIVSHLQTHDLRLLLIVDEAERIYLATLERIRKMMDVANQTGVHVQMVLSGTIELHHNFKNLALCNFQPAEERHFTLQPLTEEETGAYLTFVMGDMSQELRALVTSDLTSSIFSSSQGNLRMINRVANAALTRNDSEASSIPVEEEVAIDQKRNEPSQRRLKRKTKVRTFAFNRRYLVWGGGAVAAFIIILFLVFGGDDKPVIPPKDLKTADSSSGVEKTEQGKPVADTAQKELPSQGGKPATPLPVKIAPPVENSQESAPLSAENEKIGREEQKTGEPPVSPPPVASEVSPPEPPLADTQPQKKEDVASVPTAVPEPPATDDEKAQSGSSIEAQPGAVSTTVPDTESTSESTPSNEQGQPAPPAVAVGPGDAASGPAEERGGAGRQEQKTAQESAVPIAGRPADRPNVDQKTADTSEPDSQEITAQRSEQAALSAGPAVPEMTVVEEPIVPQKIAATKVVKHRESLTPGIPETISPEAVKIVRKEDGQTAPEQASVQPVVIKVEDQKKEQVDQPEPPATQPAAPETPEKTPARAVETPKKADGVDQIYSRRLAAGTSWVLGNKNDQYTVRLMVITSGDAEKKLKSMLGEKRYREQADKFYILRKESNPDVQYVYYGEYPTMTAARNARNTIPEFLRGYKPYAMSVKGAVERAQQEE